MWAQVLMASLDSAFCFVLAAFTTWFFSAVSTFTFSKKLIVGADLGDFVLELVGDLDLEGPSVGGKLGLGGLLNLGLHGILHINVVSHACCLIPYYVLVPLPPA
jgi:hypothetical protein